MGAFDDLLPEAPVAGAFDDLIVNDSGAADQVSRAASRSIPAPAPTWADTGDQVSRTATRKLHGVDPSLLPPPTGEEEYLARTARPAPEVSPYGEISATPAGGAWDWLTGLVQAPKIAAAKIGTGAIRATGDLLENTFLQEAGKNLRAKYEKEEARVDPVIYDDTLNSVYSGFKSAVQSVSALAVPGGPLVALTGLTTADAYGKYRDRGAKPLEAAIAAGGEGIVEYATEKAPMSFLVKKLGKVGAGEFLAGLMGREVVGEEVATLLQDAIDTAVANPKKTWGEYLRERPGAAADTLIATVSSVGAMTAANKAVQKGGQMAEQYATDAAEARAEEAKQVALAKVPSTFGKTAPPPAATGSFDDLVPASTGPIGKMAAAGGIDPLTLKPIAPQAPEQAAPAALPPPSQVAMPMGEALPVTEVPAQTPGEAHAAGVYAARAAEDARKQALTASKIEIDPADPAGSIKAIADAPLTAIAPGLAAQEGVDQAKHATASGDLAASFLQISDLQRQVKVTPKAERPALEAQIKTLQDQTRADIAQYKAQFGEAAGNHMHRVAAETFHTMKRDYQSLQKPTVQESAPSTGREQPAGVNDAVSQRSAAPLGAYPSGPQGAGQEGGQGVRQGVEGQAPAVAATPEAGRQGDRQQRSLTAPQTSVPTVGTGVPKITTAVDEAAHEAAASPTNERPQPTAAQALAGNYKMGHQTFTANGMSVSFETPAGAIREDKHNVPPKWRRRMEGVHYGYWKNTEAADKRPSGAPDKLDVMVKQGTHESWRGPVFVIDQVNPKTGKFDEHKTMIGFSTEEDARKAYLAQYEKGWKGLGSISKTTMQGFRTWARTANTTIPFAPQPHTAGALTVDELAYTVKDGKVTPPAARVHKAPSALGALIKRAGNKLATMADIGRQAALVMAKPSLNVLNHPSKPRILNPYERGVVAALIRDAIASGVPEESLRLVTSFHVYPTETNSENGHHIIWQGGERSIGFAEGVLDAIRAGDEAWTSGAMNVLIHELGHAVDSAHGTAGLSYASSESPLFEITYDSSTGFRIAQGDIVEEVLLAHRAGISPELRKFLGYPMNYWFDDASDHGLKEKELQKLIKQEVFGQLHSLYYNHPELMKRELPRSYALFKEMHDAIKSISPGSAAHTVSEVEAVVRQTLRTPGSGESLQYPGTGGYSVDRGGAVSRDTSEGMGGGVDEGGGPAEVGRGERGVNRQRLSPGEADLKGVLDALTLEERQKLDNAATAKKFVAIFKEMPASKETAAIAWAGRAKRGWYRKSALALHHVFGPDAPRFAALLAAMSPQTGVEANLSNALNTWVNWVNEGRPVSHSAIKQIMGRSVQGNKLTDSVLDAWVNNSLRALTHPFPGELIISGPKVDSFMRNLVGVVQEVTNDSWMAAYAGVAQEIFGGTTQNPLDKPVKQPGKGAGYLAMSAHVRQAAAILTRLTGETWTPAEVQETVWSWSKALYESASQDHSARAIIESKELTDKVINATPDFGSLLEEGTYADILRRSAEGAAGVQRLAEANRAAAESEAAQGAESGAGKAAPFAESTQRRLEVAAAKRLDLRRAGVPPKFLPQKKGPRPGDATMSDFDTDTEAALQKPGWAIVTATRATATELENAVANDNLESYLTKQKIEWHDVKGSYKGVDQGRSYLIFAPPEKAEQIGRKYKQESILDNRGLVYMNGAIDPAVPSATLVGSGATDSDFYSTLSNGVSFSMGLESQQGSTLANLNEDRESVVDSTELRGDGRGFTDFFSAASRGERAPDVKTYKPVLNISSIKDFSAEYVKHRGNFDDHIATSIPGFREVQQAVGAAIVETYQDKPHDVHLLDIAASEGAFNKAISAQSGGTIVTLALDPNLTMAKFFKTHSTVKGAEYEVAAFGSAEDAGKEAWTEDDGTVIKFFDPPVKYDVIHESMGFQFISNTRNAQFARAKEMLKPNGIALFEEKIKEDTPQWRRNETQKDGYKARYFTAQQMKAKAAEVLEKGAAGAAEAESKREQAVVGMNDLMTTGHEFETALKNNFMHVAQYWDSGNFKGYVASDNRAALDKFLGNLIDLNSEFSTVATPVTVSMPQAGNVFVTALEAETGREVRMELPAQDALAHIDVEVDKLTRLKICLSS